MKIRTKLNIGQPVFLLKYNSIVECHVQTIAAHEETKTIITNEKEIETVIKYSIKYNRSPSSEKIYEEDIEKEGLFIDKEECRKALMIKVMEM